MYLLNICLRSDTGMKKVNVYVYFDNVEMTPEESLREKANLFILLAQMKKEREKRK